MVRCRYELGRALLAAGIERGQPPLPEQHQLTDPFPGLRGRPPEVRLDELDADLLRRVLRFHGCVLVRGLFGPTSVARLIEDVDRMADAFETWLASPERPTTPSWFEPLDAPGAALPLEYRSWCGALGTYYAADGPRAFLDLVDAFHEVGLPELLTEYMREPVLLALEKTSLRRVPASVPSAWHQDGYKFGVDNGLVNVWVALSPCGRDAPTVGVVPRRATEILPLHDGSTVAWEIDPGALAAFAGDLPLLELEMQPGDGVIFDEMLVHGTIARPQMPNLRYGADAWFFPVSGFPVDLYRPFAFALPEA